MLKVKFLQLSMSMLQIISFEIIFIHWACKCLPLIVFEATIPGLLVSNGLGLTKVF